MRSAALAGGLLVIALGMAAFVIPSLTRERELLTTTPQPPPLSAVALVELASGEQACMDDASIDEHSDRAVLKVGTSGRPPSPLRLEIDGPGVRQVRRIPPTYVDSVPLAVPIDAPDHAIVATACVRNDGRDTVALFAGADRFTRSATRVEGVPDRANFELAFAEGERHTLLERLPLAIERMQGFRPDAPWLAWLVAILFVIGVPLGAVWAYGAAAHADEERDPTRSQVPSTLE